MKHLNVETIREYAIRCVKQGLKGELAFEHFRETYKRERNTTIPNCGIKSVFMNILIEELGE